MKRDMDLVRKLLLNLEGEENIDLSSSSDEQKLYHTALLIDAELVFGAIARGGQGQISAAKAFNLTWKGHEFIDAARDEKSWSRALAKVKSTCGTATLGIIQELLNLALKDRLGLSATN